MDDKRGTAAALVLFGLENLTSYVEANIVAGVPTPEIVQGLLQMPEYRARFASLPPSPTEDWDDPEEDTYDI